MRNLKLHLLCWGLAAAASSVLAQEKNEPDTILEPTKDNTEALQKALEEAQKKRADEEKRQALEVERLQKEEADLKARLAQEESLKARREAEAKAQSEAATRTDSVRGAPPITTEYTIDPSSVELVVEMDPQGYGFRTRNYRMGLTGEFDMLLRGRALLRYDYRFFEYFSFGLLGGIDWTDISLFSRFRQQQGPQTPKQFAVLGGVASKWRLSEWYMNSAVFLEGSVLTGYLWQELANTKSNHWRLRPGLSLGVDRVFDSGLILTGKLGVEAPFDFGQPNPVKEVAEPIFSVGAGLAI
jgi:hypothetical protein